jgi:hypothetical protein
MRFFIFRKPSREAKAPAVEAHSVGTSLPHRAPGPIESLQQAIGNHGVRGLLQTLRQAAGGSGGSQLHVSSPQDASEQEAERVAERVVAAPDANAVSADSARSRIGTPAAADDGLRASGQPLDAPTREFFAPRFGEDFDGVRVHTDETAAESAASMNAAAYTVGRDVVFGHGQYAPETAEGRKTLAHELAHVVQQRRGAEPRQIQRKLVLTGASADITRVIAVMNEGLGPMLMAKVNSAGEVSIVSSGMQGPPTTQNQLFTTQLESIVNEKGTVTIGVTSGGAPIVGSYALAQIDIADIEQLGVGQPGWDARAALLHEIVEQRERQLGTTAAQRGFGSPTTGAHGTALAAELGMIGAVLESDSGLVATATHADGTMDGTRTVVFKYPDGTRYRVEVTLSHNNITGVTRTKLP